MGEVWGAGRPRGGRPVSRHPLALVAGRPLGRPGRAGGRGIPLALRNPVANSPEPVLRCGARIGFGGVSVSGPCVLRGGRLIFSEPAVDRIYLQAIDRARRGEGLGPIALPLNFARLDAAAQIIVLTNVERVDRGLPPVAGTTPALHRAALVGAQHSTDPVLGLSGMALVRLWGDGGGTVGWGSNWAGGEGPDQVLAAWFGWMYADGWGGVGHTFNLACTSPSAAGCWGHRDNILRDWGPVPAMGVAAVEVAAQQYSYATIFVQGLGLPLATPLDRAWRVGPTSANPVVLFPLRQRAGDTR